MGTKYRTTYTQVGDSSHRLPDGVKIVSAAELVGLDEVERMCASGTWLIMSQKQEQMLRSHLLTSYLGRPLTPKEEKKYGADYVSD